MSRVRALVIALALTWSCAPSPVVRSAFPGIDVTNSTSLDVQLFVNGRLTRLVPAHSEAHVATVELPPLPWDVEARTATGRRLTGMTVRADDISSRTFPAGGVAESRGAAVRADLSCGRLDITVGPPLLGPSHGPGAPHDCDP